MREWIAAVPKGAWPSIVAITYFGAFFVSLRLIKDADGLAAMWVPSGILLAGLLASSRRQGASLLVQCACACLVANLVGGNGEAKSIVYTLANLTEALVATWLLRRRHATPLSFVAPRDVGRFCLAVGLAGFTSAGVVLISLRFAGVTAFLSWFVTDMLGMLIVTPMILTGLAALRGGSARATGDATPLQALLLLAMVAAVSGAVFGQSSYPLLFVPMVALLATTYRLGPFGAATGVLIIAIVASLLSGMGLGPLALIRVRDGQVLWFLQFYIVTLFATALPIAAILATRATLMEDCAESERVHRLLAEKSRDIVTRLSLEGVLLYVSPACRRLLGCEPEEVIGKVRIGFIHPDDRAELLRVWASVLAGARDRSCVYRERHGEGHYVWLEATYSLVRDPESGAPAEVIAAIRDVSLRRAAEIAAAESSARVEESNRLLMMAERIAHVGHWRVDLEGDGIFWSPEVYRIHGVEPGRSLTPADGLAFYHPDDRERITATVDRSVAASTDFLFAARILRGDDEVRDVVTRGEPEFAADGRLVALFGVIQDVSQQMAIERELEAARIAAEEAARAALLLADTDALTGVASRRKALRYLADGLTDARAMGWSFSIATFDIDHFKSINDRYGHAAGDEVLQRVAQVAQSMVRTGDLIGRIGGEEFLVIFPGADAALAMMAAERLRSAIEHATGAIASAPAVTISVGVAQLDDLAGALGGETEAAMLLHKADCALYAAKQAGRNTLQLAA